MTPSEHRATRLAEARQIITDPALCHAHPSLAMLAWCVLKKDKGHPILQIASPAPRATWRQARWTHE